MNNIIKATIYRTLRSKAFIGCIIFSILDLVLAIIMNKTMYSEKVIYGSTALESSITNNSILAIIFLILIAILIAEDYSLGTMKNIVGKGVNKLKYYIGNVVGIMIIYLIFNLIYSVVISIYYTILNGFGHMKNIVDVLGSGVVQFIIVFAMMFVIATTIILTKKTISGLVAGCIILYIPSILSIIALFINLKIKFDVASLNYYQNILGTGNFHSEILLQGTCVAICYIVVAIIITNIILKKQEVK